MQREILKLVRSINPSDATERAHIKNTIQWIESGAELFRIREPDVPPKHLVSCFVLIDPFAGKLLLVDHVKAQLWLPTGGHVEPNEHPTITVQREVLEELGIEGGFIYRKPFFLTQTVTVGLTAGHTDVCLWYTLQGDSTLPIQYDHEEFSDCRWFNYEEVLDIPIEKLYPPLHRFTRKWMRDPKASN